MRTIALRVLSIMLFIAVMVLLYYGILWFCAAMGFVIPGHILQVIAVIFVILVAIYALSGRLDSWWASP